MRGGGRERGREERLLRSHFSGAHLATWQIVSRRWQEVRKDAERADGRTGTVEGREGKTRPDQVIRLLNVMCHIKVDNSVGRQ